MNVPSNQQVTLVSFPGISNNFKHFFGLCILLASYHIDCWKMKENFWPLKQWPEILFHFHTVYTYQSYKCFYAYFLNCTVCITEKYLRKSEQYENRKNSTVLNIDSKIQFLWNHTVLIFEICGDISIEYI